MFSHITVGSADLKRAEVFYNQLLKPLGFMQRDVQPDGGPPSCCWGLKGRELPRFYVYSPFDGKAASAGNGSMVAFLAPSIQSVNEAYAAGLAAGGVCEGEPGERPHYGRGYYGAYLRDPDGNKIHVVYRGDL